MATEIKADTSLWSDESKRSYAFDYIVKYEDIPYECFHCKKSCVFSAEEQKHFYEILKKYYWNRRNLCSACLAIRRSYKNQIASCRDAWKENRAALTQDEIFLNRWLFLIENIWRYGENFDGANIKMLQRLLKKFE